MRQIWMAVWRFYDSPQWGGHPRRIAPWLLGKALGSKPGRIGTTKEESE